MRITIFKRFVFSFSLFLLFWSLFITTWSNCKRTHPSQRYRTWSIPAWFSRKYCRNSCSRIPAKSPTKSNGIKSISFHKQISPTCAILIWPLRLLDIDCNAIIDYLTSSTFADDGRDTMLDRIRAVPLPWMWDTE